MTIEEVREYADYERKKDLKKLEHHSRMISILESVEKEVEKLKRKKENQHMISEYDLVLYKLDTEIGGSYTCFKHYAKKLKTFDYEEEAKNRLKFTDI